jgi:hypothetical protein
MPAELRDRFPFSAKDVEDYEQQKTAKAKARREQTRAEAYAALLRQEAEAQARIQTLQRQLTALQRELDVINVSARRKPKSAARREADQMRVRKQDLIRHLEQLRDQTDALRKLQVQYR